MITISDGTRTIGPVPIDLVSLISNPSGKQIAVAGGTVTNPLDTSKPYKVTVVGRIKKDNTFCNDTKEKTLSGPCPTFTITAA
jgi:hypothetical protein